MDMEMMKTIYHPLHWRLFTQKEDSPLQIYHNGRLDVLYVKPGRNYSEEEQDTLAKRIFDEERELISNKLELFILQQKLPAYLA